MTDLRDRIARALHRQVVVEAQSHRIDIEVHSEGIAFERRLADAVLAVLADLPDEVIEKAARAWFLNGPTTARYESVSARLRRRAESMMRATFAAVFGGEQA